MKNIIGSVGILIGATSFASEVCVISQYKDGSDYITKASCTQESDSSQISVYYLNDGFATLGLKQAQLIKALMAKGYSIQSKDLLVKP